MAKRIKKEKVIPAEKLDALEELKENRMNQRDKALINEAKAQEENYATALLAEEEITEKEIDDAYNNDAQPIAPPERIEAQEDEMWAERSAELESASYRVYGEIKPCRIDSIFNLMAIAGAMNQETGQMIDVNEYLKQRAVETGKESVVQLSKEEYQDIIDDTESFKEWAAKQWVDEYIKNRKDELKTLAKTIATRSTDNNYVDLPKLDKEFVGKVNERNRADNTLADLSIKNERELVRQTEELEKKRKQLLESLETTLRASNTPDTVINQIITETDNTLAKIDEGLLSATKKEMDSAIAEARKVFQDRKGELSDLEKQAQNIALNELPKELALSAERWGDFLRKLAVYHPTIIRRNEETGEITLDFNNLYYGTDSKFIFEHFDNELDLIKEPDKNEDARTKNLETIIKTRVEALLAKSYLDDLIVKKFTRFERGESRNNREKINLIYSHLLDSQLLSRSELLKLEKKAITNNIELEKSALIVVIGEEKDNQWKAETKEKPTYPTVIKEVCQLFITKLDKLSTGDPVYTKQMSDFFSATMNQGKMDTAHFDQIVRPIIQSLFQKIVEVRQTMEDSPHGEKEKLDRIMAQLYNVCSKHEIILTRNKPGFLDIPPQLQNDLLHKVYLRNHNNKGNIANAAMDQFRLLCLDWVRRYPNGKDATLINIRKIANKINEEMTMQDYHGDTSNLMADTIARHKKMGELIEKNGPLLKKLEELSEEIKKS